MADNQLQQVNNGGANANHRIGINVMLEGDLNAYHVIAIGIAILCYLEVSFLVKDNVFKSDYDSQFLASMLFLIIIKYIMIRVQQYFRYKYFIYMLSLIHI